MRGSVNLRVQTIRKRIEDGALVSSSDLVQLALVELEESNATDSPILRELHIKRAEVYARLAQVQRR